MGSPDGEFSENFFDKKGEEFENRLNKEIDHLLAKNVPYKIPIDMKMPHIFIGILVGVILTLLILLLKDQKILF
ncbi:MAG: hypothetical protein NDI62_01055 [Burkholderiales bacterium]|nr:hypothetical protein [Burkholderiales bacterium]